MILTEPRLALIRLLSDGACHSGRALGAQLGVSRSAISQHIAALTRLGLPIYSQAGLGHRLAAPIELLDPTRLHAALPNARLHYFAEIDSTNQFMLDGLDQFERGSYALAEYQSAGRGRRGRHWITPFGAQLPISLYWRLERGLAAAMGVSLAVGVALVEGLTAAGIEGVTLKWPNDLYWQGRKLGGILVESQSRGDLIHLVIGFGLNVALPLEVKQQIDQPCTDLQEILGKTPSRNALVIALIQQLITAMQQFEAEGLTPFVERWNRYDAFAGCPVQLLQESGATSGIARGIDGQGFLQLEQEGNLLRFPSGEISMRSLEPRT